MKPPYSIISWSLFYIFIASLLLANSFGYLDPDFGWHLRVGEEIAQTRSVPHDQIYMWPLAGQAWVDHEWLANFLIYQLWQAGGYLAVTFFFVILILGTLALLNYYVFKNYLQKNQGRFIFAGLEILAVVACLPHLGVRIQEFALLGTTLLFIIIDQCRQQQKTTIVFWLIPLLFIWACLHGSFLFGAGIIIGWLIYEAGLFFWPPVSEFLKEKKLPGKELKKLLLFILLALSFTFVTPYGLELYNFLADYGQNRYYLSHIEEWRTPFSSPLPYYQIIYSGLMLAFGLNLFITKKRRPLWQLTILLLLFILALRSIRHFPLWAIGSLLFLTPAVILEELKNLVIPGKKWLLALALFCLGLASLSLLSETTFISKPFISYCDFYPCGAVEFLANHPEKQTLKIFNDYGWGGYLIATLPQMRLFIDGRLPQYTLNSQTILEEYGSFFAKEQAAQKLAEHQIELVILKAAVKPAEPDWFEYYFLGQRPSEDRNLLLDYLKENKQWKNIYQDKVSIIYQRQ